MNHQDLKLFLKEQNFIPSKKMGQNFLIDQNIQRVIVDSIQINNNDWILEIGPGLGAITTYLHKLTKNIILVELDKRLYSYLKLKFNDVFLINNDILKVDLQQLKDELKIKQLKVVSNIPYSISSPIIIFLLRYDFIDQINLLVQKEMAQHICAKVNDKNYNSFTILVRFYYDSKILFKVSSSCFFPQPKVESAFVKMQRNLKYDHLEFAKIANLLKIAFHAKRKTLFNNLIIYFNKEDVTNFFNELNWDLNLRPQQLSNEDFYNLYKKIYIKS